MPRDRDAAKLRPDANEIAYRTIRAALGEAEKPDPPGTGTKNPAAVKRGRKGGRKGVGQKPKTFPRPKKRRAG